MIPAADDLAALLDWYVAMGADAALGEEPVDRFAASAARARPQTHVAEPAAAPLPQPLAQSPSAEALPARPGQVVAPTEETARQARSVAALAPDLDALRAALESFEGCNLRLTAKNLVFADGRPGARVMLVGEAPGKEEDQQGVPFVGRSGQLLDLMLGAVGMTRQDVYIANVVPWRPPGNRTPTPQETATCRPFIERQIALCDPDILVCLGGASAKELLGTTEGILRLRGQWREFDTGRRKIRALATLHPAYLLRNPLQKRLAWRDFLALKAALKDA